MSVCFTKWLAGGGDECSVSDIECCAKSRKIRGVSASLHRDLHCWEKHEKVVCIVPCFQAFYGEGVNIYMSSIQWGGEKVLNRVHYELILRKKWQRRFRLSENQQETVRTSIGRKRKEFAAVLVHNMRQRVRVDRVVLRRHAAWDLPTYMLLPLNLVRVMKGRARSQQS